jgi:hypothetical protein
LLSPYRGNLILINSKLYAIPDSGPTLSTGGLSSSTLYYIYVYDNAGTLTLEASATAYATQAGTGIKIKSGDATRTLVGMARTDGSTAWADSATQRFVRSWFNDPGIGFSNAFTANRSTASATYAEINSEIRCEFLAWTGEVINVSAGGQVFNGTAGAFTYTSVGFNGATAEDTFAFTETFGSVGTGQTAAVALVKTGLTEGYNYVTLIGKVGTGTGQWTGSATAGLRTTLRGYAKL